MPSCNSKSTVLMWNRLQIHTCFSAKEVPILAHKALIFQMLLEHLNFCTSILGPRPALINGAHLSWHHVALRPCPARQLCFRIMGALHLSPYHAMIVHLCDLSVKPLCQKGQQGTVQSEGARHCSMPFRYSM